ncbi:MAG: metallophosphoesterase [Clostridiales bacterium]|nr:metallophosphoesterase [Clostridiales bacterium]
MKKAPRGKSKKKRLNTLIQLKRGLRTGGATTVKYTRGLMGRFNEFTTGQSRAGQSTRRWMTFSRLIAGTAALLVLLMLMMDNRNVDVERITLSVPGLGRELEGYTILHLSDLHGATFGAGQSMLRNTLDSLSYNMAILSGDMVGAGGDPQPLYDLLDGLRAGRPTYFVAGDSDPAALLGEPRDVVGSLREHVLADWILGAEQHGAQYLDAPTALAVGNARIWLTPDSMLNLNASLEMERITNEAKAQEDAVIEGDAAARGTLARAAYRKDILTRLSEAIKAMDAGDLHIAVGHVPPAAGYLNSAAVLSAQNAEDVASYLQPVDLALAGHYCGGQWKLPFAGALYIPAPEAARHGWFPAQGDVEGIRLLGGTALYVNGGLGATDRIYLPRFRLFNTPKVALITLTSSLTDDLLGG